MVIITFLSPGFSLDIGMWQNAGQWDWGISVRRHIASHCLFSSGLCHLNVMSGTVAAILYPWGKPARGEGKADGVQKMERCWLSSPCVLDNIPEPKFILCPEPALWETTFTYCQSQFDYIFLTRCQKHSNWYNG